LISFLSLFKIPALDADNVDEFISICCLILLTTLTDDDLGLGDWLMSGAFDALWDMPTLDPLVEMIDT
jgi:hypothetical protein